jgi:DNA-binding transcriptional MerR regulator
VCTGHSRDAWGVASMAKSADAFRTISEVADGLGIPKHVLRFWEVKFTNIRPMKRGGGRRYYRPEDMELLRGIRHLLHREGYTIKGVQKILREQGVDIVKQYGRLAEEDGAPLADAPPALKDTPPQHVASPEPASRAAAPSTRMRVQDTKPSGAKADHTMSVVKAAIAELNVCRAILTGSGAQTKAPQRRTAGTYE